MSNQLELMKAFQAALPAAARAKIAAAQGKLNQDLAEGITSGFSIVSLRGKNWRVKSRGEERVLMTPDGRAPAYAIEVVIVKASPHISKVWYEHGYTEGSNAPPDCWSVNGVAPDPASPKRQNLTCAGCKWNAWGSSRTQGGSGKGKDCADSKRLAIAPAGDIENEKDGGPMLLRVPPASLADTLSYAEGLAQMGVPYDTVVTELSFDLQAEYPKIIFKPLRPLTDDEYAKVEKLQENPVTERILETAVDHVQTDGVDTSHTGVASQTPAQPVQQPQKPPAGFTPKPAPAQPATNVVPLHDKATGEIMEEVPDTKREALRAAGIPDKAIEELIGKPVMRPKAPPPKPEPKPEPPKEDPRTAALKAAGFTDEQIKAALAATTSKGNGAEAPQPEPPKRTRRTKAEMEAARAATGAPAIGAPAVEKSQTEAAPAELAEQPAALPADFDAFIDDMIKTGEQSSA